MVLGVGAGVALIRLGIRGREHRAAVEDLIPAWAAISILLGFLVTVSLIDFALLLVVTASLWMVSQNGIAQARSAIPVVGLELW